MRRREFIAGIGGAAAWPVVARAQQPVPVIGFLGSASAALFSGQLQAFRQGLGVVGSTRIVLIFSTKAIL